MFLSDKTYESLSISALKLVSTSTLKLLNEAILFPLRRRYLTRILAPHLKNSKSVLDLGASDGKLAALLQNKLASQDVDTNFMGCDVHLQSETHIPVIRYNGHHLPFPDNSFDCVLIIDVLHHTEEALQVIQEAKRVANKYVLIKDHYWNTSKDFTSLKLADFIGNKPYDIHLPYQFLTEQNWHEMIETCQMNIVTSQKFRFNQLDPCKHILFKLEV
ncbi:class I SAM-dependent methyltransferase [Chroogloeocystis siderophila]|jgi:SAM-dependent methyltransferase|uniref:Methyltransferase type 11 domain-containing protein n=1 Tax=Chroogloeocystis siderophila 5.2 s.c.1 TaxID=247279 RepID=A0A1U7HHN0_9CHRO|nr:class I SAM-dependent methyltransferase [Chroogloeocystis siderophila]OKH23090.1 hypothetical protein NIES1031_18450 [Chroogloeocystis siderophila 5.2 s.c.1]